MLEPLKVLTSRAGRRVLIGLLVGSMVSAAALARRAVDPPAAIERITSEALVGFVRPTDISSIMTPIALTVAEIVAAPGDEVTAGQPIARIDRTDGERELAHLRLEIDRATQDVAERERVIAWTAHANQRLVTETAQAGADLALAERETQQVPVRQMRDSPERAQVAYEKAIMKERRAEQLAASGLMSKQDVDDARFEVRMASDDLANARRAAEAATRVHAAEETQARARHDLSLADQQRQLAEQQAQLRQARIRLQETKLRHETIRGAVADAFVRAPRAGAIVDLPVHSGDRLPAGALVAKIAPLDPVAVDVDVSPLVVNMLRVNGLASVDVPAVKLLNQEGRIRSIAPLPGDDGKYSVQVTLPNPTRSRLAGQTANVKLIIERPVNR
jgi:multidrug resistance efflux pump